MFGISRWDFKNHLSYRHPEKFVAADWSISRDGGGFESLRTATRNSKILRIIPHPPGGVCKEYCVSGKGPIQQDLSSEPVANLTRSLLAFMIMQQML